MRSSCPIQRLVSRCVFRVRDQDAFLDSLSQPRGIAQNDTASCTVAEWACSPVPPSEAS